MSEEKTPCTEPETKTGGEQYGPAEATPAPGVVRRKKVVVVSSPPAWKAKKRNLRRLNKRPKPPRATLRRCRLKR
ncbi:hypothetical protein MKZ44_27760 (plasmid) [Klebsiella pneumoniae]|nr:hypothetical protein MKZ44_27760 [Klebsiella pneumoniae]